MIVQIFTSAQSLRPVRALLILILVLMVVAPTSAQRFGGGRGGGGPRGGGGGFFGGPPGGGPPSLFAAFRQEGAIEDLNLSEEQRTQLEELQTLARPDRDAMAPFLEKMRSAETDEERQSIGAEMQKMMQDRQTEAEGKLKDVLNESQLNRTRELLLQQAGTRALLRDDLAASVGLSDQQKQELESLLEQSNEARRNLGFRASREEREAVEQEWNEKLTNVLTADQKQKFETARGKPLVVAQNEGPSPAAPPTQMTPRRVFVEEVDPNAEVTANFGNAGASAEAKTEGFSEDARLSFNFRYAPWSDVLKLFAETAGLTLDLNAVPPGTFNYYDDGEYSPTEVIDILNGYLLPKGYILVRRNEFLVALNIDEGIPPNLVPNISVGELPDRGKNELLNVVFPIVNADVTAIANEVQQLVGPQGKVVPLATSNALVVTDIGSNLRRIQTLLTGVSGVQPDQLQFQSFQIEHIPAVEAERVVRSILGLPGAVANVSAAREDFRRDSRSSSSNSSSSTVTQVAADPRTNQLLVTAKASDLKIIEQTLETVDVSDENAAFAGFRTGPYLQVYVVNNSDAREVAKTLDAVYPGVVVNEDGRNGRLHIMADQKQHQELSAIIRQLDGTGGGGQAMSVIALSQLDPAGVTITLNAMFASDGEQAPVIQPDLLGRRLMIRGSEDQIAQVKNLLMQLGELGADGQVVQAVDRGPIRTIPLGGRDPQQVLNLLEQMWGKSRPNALRIIRPRSPDENSESNAQPSEASRKNVMTPGVTQNDLSVPWQVRPVSNRLLAQATTKTENSADDLGATGDSTSRTPSRTPDPSESDVTITVTGGDLMVISRDPDALDEVESMIQSLAQTIPVKTTWNVFYLRSSSAEDAAAMLEQLFPTSSVSSAATGASSDSLVGSLTSGISSMGGSLMDLAGFSGLGMDQTTLRIIPEIRLNALFIAGPEYMVEEVSQILEVLDESDLPNTLRDRVPRMIPVEHSDVNEVAAIVRDVYKDLLEPPQIPGGGRGGNPLQALMGGGAPANIEELLNVKLTIGVDDRTNHLIISASESLFKEIETLVNSIDQAAYDARRTIRVVTLENTNSATMQGTLSSVIPRVKVSTTGGGGSVSRSTTNSSPSRSSSDRDSDQSSNDGRPNPDQIRAFFEQRMRERMSGGGGDGPGFGPGGGRGSGGARPGGGRPGGGRGGR